MKTNPAARALCAGLILVALLFSRSALAEEKTPAAGSLAAVLKLAPVDDVVKAAILKSVEKDAKEPDLLNAVLDALKSPRAGEAGNLAPLAGLLSSLNLRFKAFETKGAATGSALGLTYSFERAMQNHEINSNPSDRVSLSFTVHAKGDIAFDPKQNPNDFLDTGASFDLFGSKGGFEPVPDPDFVQALLVKAAAFTGTPAELDASPIWREIQQAVGSHLSTQYFWRASGNFSLESNQDFTKKQYAYGLLMSGVIRAWNQDGAWAKFNVADWPFASLRYLLGTDPAFSPSGRAIPLVLAGLEQVDPSKNKDRLAVDPSTSTYSRIRGEISMKTKLAQFSGKNVWVFGSYRRFYELSPPVKVRAAGLDQFEYWAMGLELEGGLSATYSKGRLPLDRKKDQVFDLGYKLKL